MSEFPAHWDFKTIGDFASRVRAKNTGGECQDPMTISAIDGLVSQRDYFNKIVASKNTEGYTLLHKNDFAYNKSYSDGYPVGAVRRLKTKDRGIVSPLYICFELHREQIDLHFADYLFDSDWFVQAIYGIAKEGARSHGLLNIGIEEFFSASLPIPPLPEQKKIAEILSGIDLLRAKADERKTKLEQTLKAFLYEYPRKHSDGAILLENCSSLQAGGTPDRGIKEFWGGPIPWVKTGEINYNVITTTEETISEVGQAASSARLVPKGSVLMAMYGQGVTRGRVAILGISAATNQACLAINTLSEEISNEYLYHILASKYDELRGQVQEGTQKNLSKGIIGKQEIPLLKEYRQVEFCRVCAELNLLINLANRKLRSLQVLRQSVSADLLSGRKRVSV
jgi:type I restriction enzyme S subunit